MSPSSAAVKRTPSLWHDIRRDWQRWSEWERITAVTLGIGTLATAAFCLIADGWLL